MILRHDFILNQNKNNGQTEAPEPLVTWNVSSGCRFNDVLKAKTTLGVKIAATLDRACWAQKCNLFSELENKK
jgi:hypothetical protein